MTQDQWDDALNLPQDTAWMNDVGLEDLPTDCKAMDGRINLGEKCPILADAVGRMVGEIRGAHQKLFIWRNDKEAACKKQREQYDKDISSAEFDLQEAQIALAQATAVLNMNEQTLKSEVAEFDLQEAQIALAQATAVLNMN